MDVDVDYQPIEPPLFVDLTEDPPVPVGGALFVEEDGESMNLWVHPDLPNRSEVIDQIQRHGGSVVDNVSQSSLAIMDTKSCDNLILEQCPGEVSGISSQWVRDSIERSMSVDPGPYIIWDPLLWGDARGTVKLQPEQAADPDNTVETDSDDEQGDVPHILLPPPNFNKPPTAADRAIDENWLLRTAPAFFSDNPKASWEALYRWCARNCLYRSKEYWADLNNVNTPFRERMNAALEEIREPYMLRSLAEKPEESDDETSSSASASSAESHNVSKPSRSFRTSYTPSLRAAMVEHIALNPDTPIMTLWRSFHTKHPERSVAAYHKYHRLHAKYFTTAVEQYLGGRNNHEGDIAVKALDALGQSLSASGSGSGCDEGSQKIESSQSARGRRELVRFTHEERQKMAEFFAKVRPECERDGDVWVKFSELYPSRSATSYHTYAAKHPQIRRLGSGLTNGGADSGSDDQQNGEEQDGVVSSPRRKRFSPQEHSILFEWASKRGFPSKPSSEEWAQFHAQHPERSIESWRHQYRIRIYPRHLEKKLTRINTAKNRPQLESDGESEGSSGGSGDEDRAPVNHGRRGLRPRKNGRYVGQEVVLGQKRRLRSSNGATMPGPRAKRARRDSTPSERTSSESSSDSSDGSQTESEQLVQNSDPKDDAITPPPPPDVPSSSETRSVEQVTVTHTQMGPRFTHDDWLAIMQWAMTRPAPFNTGEDVSSWKIFATMHSSHSEQEWIGFYFTHYHLFEPIERQYKLSGGN